MGIFLKRFFYTIIITLCLLAYILWALLGTEPGKRTTIKLVNYSLQNYDVPVLINKIITVFPLNIDILFPTLQKQRINVNAHLVPDKNLRKTKFICKISCKKFTYNQIDIANFLLVNEWYSLWNNPVGTIDINLKIKQEICKIKSDISYKNALLIIDKVNLLLPKGFIKGNLVYDFSAQNLKCTYEMSIPDIWFIPGLTGNVQSNATINILPQNSNVSLFLSGKNITYKKIKLARVLLHVQANDILQNPQGQLSLKCKECDLFNLDFQTLQTNITFANKQKGILFISGKGNNLDLKINANIQSKQQNSYNIDFTQALFKYYNDILVIKQHTNIELKPNYVKINPTNIYFNKAPINLHGTIVDEKLNIFLDGVIKVKKLGRMIIYDASAIEGDLLFKLHFYNFISNPFFEGNITLKNGSYKNFSHGINIQNIKLNIEANNKSIILKQGVANDEKQGKLNLSGTYDIVKKNLNCQLNIQNFLLSHINNIIINIDSSNIQILGNITEKLTLKGFIKTGEVKYDIASLLSYEVPSLNVVNNERKRPIKKKNPFLARLNLDLNLIVPSVLEINGIGLSSIWQGKINISSTAEQPIIQGKIQLQKGELNFFSAKMKMLNGLIVFDKYKDNIPYVNMHAIYEKDDISVALLINGRATIHDLTLKLQASPSMPKSAIFSYLLFGSKKEKLSPIQALQLAKTISYLNNNLSALSEAMQASSLTDRIFKKDKKASPDNVRNFWSQKVTIDFDHGSSISDTNITLGLQLTSKILAYTSKNLLANKNKIGIKYQKSY